MPKVETVLSPALIPFHPMEGKVAVIIDVLRATTSICYALGNGARRIVPTTTPDECILYAKRGFLCAAERNGLQVDGFDLGNSPTGFTPDVVKGRDIALTTTNGTYTLLESHEAEHRLIGSFLNLTALIEELKALKLSVVLVCAGWKNKVNLEDTLFAGAVAEGLKDEFEEDCDSTLMARDLWNTHRSDPSKLLRQASHARRFERLGIDDLPFCLQIDLLKQVPVYRHGEIIV